MVQMESHAKWMRSAFRTLQSWLLGKESASNLMYQKLIDRIVEKQSWYSTRKIIAKQMQVVVAPKAKGKAKAKGKGKARAMATPTE